MVRPVRGWRGVVRTKIYPVYSLTQIRGTPRIQIAGQSVVSVCRLVAYGACQERGQGLTGACA
ncbi:hypothetical protein [Mycobacterium phage Fezzik]|nr:hypothetical protein [Mycobacterium phage Fezzik]